MSIDSAPPLHELWARSAEKPAQAFEYPRFFAPLLGITDEQLSALPKPDRHWTLEALLAGSFNLDRGRK
ncbi:MAG: hypothetical protein JWM95_1048 [Gemmatimonadetes bacterium]|nr:hypothetical protein [Gemmatimonadota bacterium]